MIKDQLITEDYAIYCSDNMFVLPSFPDNSIPLSVYSPPFAGLYNYSSSPNDFSNCESREQFLNQYEYLIAETGNDFICSNDKVGKLTMLAMFSFGINTCLFAIVLYPVSFLPA